MSEIDIWIKVFDKIGIKFIDEIHSRQTGINYLKYNQFDKNGLHIADYSICFKYDTGEVIMLVHELHYKFGKVAELNKKSFFDKYKDIFREVKLEEII